MLIPKIKFERVTEYSELVLQFDREMIIPSNLNTIDFSKILAFTWINEEQDTRVEG